MESMQNCSIAINVIQAPHCVRCGTCHSETQCTTFVESFYWPYQAQQVYVLGEWNQWSHKEPMVKMEGYFVCQVSLNPGCYQHKFIVDGEWLHDEMEPVIKNEFGTYNNVKEVIPKRAYLDEYHICEQDDDYVEITIQTNLIQDGMKIIGSWDDWKIQRPLHLETNLLKNYYVNSLTIKLEKGKKYEFKFKNSKGEYFTDQHYPALPNSEGTMNNYVIASSYAETKTPKLILESLSRSTSVHQTQWEWQRQDFDELQSYNLYGHSLTCVGNMLYIFGGIYRNQFRDYLIKIPLWDFGMFQQQKVNIPARAYHSSVADGNKIIIFGGLNTTVLNDCKIYNTATHEWSESLVINGAPPSSREKSTSVLYKDLIIVYGGYYCCPKTELEIIYNDIHILNTQSMTWNKPSSGMMNAPAVFAHSATVHEDSMLVFGGIHSMDEEGDSNQLWRLKINKDHLAWSIVETVGKPPCPRHGHTANILNHYLVVFAGANQKQFFNDVVMLDLDNNCWITPLITGQIPREVVYHAAAEVSNELIVIGGKTSGAKYVPGVLILKPKRDRRKSFSSYSQNNDQIFLYQD